MLQWIKDALGSNQPSSKDTAKGRLLSLLPHDRAGITPNVIEDLRGTLIDFCSKNNINIDKNNLDVDLVAGERSINLVINGHIVGERNIQ